MYKQGRGGGGGNNQQFNSRSDITYRKDLSKLDTDGGVGGGGEGRMRGRRQQSRKTTRATKTQCIPFSNFCINGKQNSS